LDWHVRIQRHRSAGRALEGVTGSSSRPDPRDGEHQFVIIGDRERFDLKYLSMSEN